MAGSIRQRGRNSWQIRVYAGTDPETGQRRQLTRTVQGSSWWLFAAHVDSDERLITNHPSVVAGWDVDNISGI